MSIFLLHDLTTVFDLVSPFLGIEKTITVSPGASGSFTFSPKVLSANAGETITFNYVALAQNPAQHGVKFTVQFHLKITKNY